MSASGQRSLPGAGQTGALAVQQGAFGPTFEEWLGSIM
jgi:hypothetical protein